MFAKSMIAAALALSIAAALPASKAEAKSDIDINIGIGFGGAYDGTGFADWEHDEPLISCAEARSIVRHQGFRNIRTLDCSAPNYRFSGWIGFRQYTIKITDEGLIKRIRQI
jgi:hypothetical protein